MQFKEKCSLFIIGVVYFIFNFDSGLSDLSKITEMSFLQIIMSIDPRTAIMATLINIMKTAPYVIGATLVLVSFLQYLSDGQKVPWYRVLRLFFIIGIIAGFVYAIYVPYARHDSINNTMQVENNK